MNKLSTWKYHSIYILFQKYFNTVWGCVCRLKAPLSAHPHRHTDTHTHARTRRNTKKPLPEGIFTISCFREQWSMTACSCDGVRGSEAQKCPSWPKEKIWFLKKIVWFFMAIVRMTNFQYLYIQCFFSQSKLILLVCLKTICNLPTEIVVLRWKKVDQFHSIHLLIHLFPLQWEPKWQIESSTATACSTALSLY